MDTQTSAAPLTNDVVDPYYEGVPDYMVDVYDWAYVNPVQVDRLDHNLVVRVLLFGNDQRLMRAYLNEIRPGMRVWQVAHVYGDLVTRVADKVGPQGSFHLTDITPAQVEHAERKLAGRPWAQVYRADAAHFDGHGEYDLICSFFLLHEVPEDKKRETVRQRGVEARTQPLRDPCRPFRLEQAHLLRRRVPVHGGHPQGRPERLIPPAAGHSAGGNPPFRLPSLPSRRHAGTLTRINEHFPLVHQHVIVNGMTVMPSHPMDMTPARPAPFQVTVFPSFSNLQQKEEP